MSNKDDSRLSIRPVSGQEQGNEKSGAEVKNVEVEADKPAEAPAAPAAAAAAANGGLGNYVVGLKIYSKVALSSLADYKDVSSEY
jgi:hypothetical protein